MATTSLEDERRQARTPAVARDFMASTDGWRVVSVARVSAIAAG